MNPQDLRKLAEAATPGPWAASAIPTNVITNYRDELGNATSENYHKNGYAKQPAFCKRHEDAKFIAAANPATVIRLLDIIAQCKEALRSISLCEFNSMSSRQEMGRLSRDALAAIERFEGEK